MKTILILGAGRSSPSLISYLLREAALNNWRIVIGDGDIRAVRERIEPSSYAEIINFNIQDRDLVLGLISRATVVISLLPPSLHSEIAKYCLVCKRHLLTASYVSAEMKGFHEEALANELLFLNECGLDPGIDHMSAMQLIDKIKGSGGVLTSFESFTGGLIAPETDPENPWRYKFTWNPRNVVTAGQGTAKFLQDGRTKYIPYHQLFTRTTSVYVAGYGDYEGYVNRDSLKYIEIYGLEGIRTMLRGTLRYKGFCAAWNILVQLGCCDDSYEMDDVETMTHHDFLDSFLRATKEPTESRLIKQLNLDLHAPELYYLRWSGFFDDELIGTTKRTPAQILEHILTKKWRLISGDKDMIVMWHRFLFEEEGKEKQIQASLVIKGEDSTHTAMAKTVGWPLGIAAKLLLQGKIKQRGVVIPVTPELYEPILRELGVLGVYLDEKLIIKK